MSGVGGIDEPTIRTAQFVRFPGEGVAGELVIGMTDSSVYRYSLNGSELFRLLHEAAALLPDRPEQLIAGRGRT